MKVSIFLWVLPTVLVWTLIAVTPAPKTVVPSKSPAVVVSPVNPEHFPTGPRTEITRVVSPDTSVFRVRNDTIKYVVYDTLKITKTLKDTVLVVKTDTVKTSSKPIPAGKK